MKESIKKMLIVKFQMIQWTGNKNLKHGSMNTLAV